MPDISDVFCRLIEDDSLGDALSALTEKNSQFLYQLALSLAGIGKKDGALDVCEEVLRTNPRDLDMSFLSLRLLSEKDEIERIFDRITFMKNAGFGSETLTEEIRSQLNHAVDVHGQCLEGEDYEKAMRISSALARFYPDITFFKESESEDLGRLRAKYYKQYQEYEEKHYNSLTELAEIYRQAQDYEGEIKYRQDVFCHPHDATRHSALRLQNIVLLITRILDVERETVTPQRLALVKELQAAIATIPSTPLIGASFHEDPAARFDRFYRLLLDNLEVDDVFGSAGEPLPLLPATFMSATGEPMDLDALAARGKELGARVVFSTSTSAEYFARYARSYISSMLKEADCSCMVIVYVCAPKERLGELVASLGMDDPRLIFCSDDFDPKAQEITLYTPTDGDPHLVHGIYYAASALLRSEYSLQILGLPVFVMGIDTILQRGVVDLIDKFADADVVLNKAGSQFTIGSQLVNNIVLLYPRANALLFVDFLKKYLGKHMKRTVQPAFLDQMDLHMAKHHLLANGNAPKLGFFDEYDINNVMFNKDNYQEHYEKLIKYRFLNMFIGGNPTNALTTSDVGAEEGVEVVADADAGAGVEA